MVRPKASRHNSRACSICKKPVAQGWSQTAVLPEKEMGPIVDYCDFQPTDGDGEANVECFMISVKRKERVLGGRWVTGVFFNFYFFEGGGCNETKLILMPRNAHCPVWGVMPDSVTLQKISTFYKMT